MKTSINFKVAKSDSEIHNFRKKSFDYIRKDLTHKNEYLMEQKIADRLLKIEAFCKEKSGRKLQKNAMPVREAVVVIKENTTMQDLHNLSKKLEEELKIRIFQIAIHKDEGHYDKDTKEWKPNYHAHLVADWQDLQTGKTLKHQSFHYSKMQDLAAECLEMERGISGSLARLEAVEFKIKKKEEDLKILEERYSQMQQEMESKKAEDLIIKETDFLGFQKIKTDKTIENYKKAIKTNNIQLLKNKTELESKEKQIVELKTNIESLKKEVSFFKSKNSALLTNETVFAVEKKKYLDSVEHTLKKTILQQSIKIPNIQNLNNAELKDKMIEILEKTSKENRIPVSAFEEVFRISEKQINLFSLLRFDHRINKVSEQNKVNSMKDNSLNIESQTMKEPEERKGFKR
ncbi:plasmid recombination protein [Elizabethkingia miricola]|uniref:plasmid recombination protein n=1 Tax=Elizabethkingia miricola TaxID=172045 RepID=UPI001F236185|nr:plasmid recombination protein [Elizabethkingia miricola]UIO95446.1 plasmid recombination protein [Elizabethkingia miricola]